MSCFYGYCRISPKLELNEYVYLNGTRLALFRQTGTTHYYIADHLSTAQLLVDDQGAVVWQGNYTPFGAVDVVINELENDFRFPGQYWDAETGLHYNWNRYYDPATGRYITADPTGLEGGMNLYAYVGGNPINKFDFMGLAECVYDYNLCVLACNLRYEYDPLKNHWFDEHTKAAPPIGYCASSDSPGVCEGIVLGHYWKEERRAKKKQKECLDQCEDCKEQECAPSH